MPAGPGVLRTIHLPRQDIVNHTQSGRGARVTDRQQAPAGCHRPGTPPQTVTRP